MAPLFLAMRALLVATLASCALALRYRSEAGVDENENKQLQRNGEKWVFVPQASGVTGATISFFAKYKEPIFHPTSGGATFKKVPAGSVGTIRIGKYVKMQPSVLARAGVQGVAEGLPFNPSAMGTATQTEAYIRVTLTGIGQFNQRSKLNALWKEARIPYAVGDTVMVPLAQMASCMVIAQVSRGGRL